MCRRSFPHHWLEAAHQQCSVTSKTLKLSFTLYYSERSKTGQKLEVYVSFCIPMCLCVSLIWEKHVHTKTAKMIILVNVLWLFCMKLYVDSEARKQRANLLWLNGRLTDMNVGIQKVGLSVYTTLAASIASKLYTVLL